MHDSALTSLLSQARDCVSEIDALLNQDSPNQARIAQLLQQHQQLFDAYFTSFSAQDLSSQARLQINTYLASVNTQMQAWAGQKKEIEHSLGQARRRDKVLKAYSL